MGILDMLGLTGDSGGAPSHGSGHGDTDTVRRIAGELDALEPDRARFLAAFAYVLSRVAHADSEVCVHETETMKEIVQKLVEMGPVALLKCFLMKMGKKSC